MWKMQMWKTEYQDEVKIEFPHEVIGCEMMTVIKINFSNNIYIFVNYALQFVFVL